MRRSTFKSSAYYFGACSIVAMATVLGAAPAMAADAAAAASADNSSTALEEVVVTARKVSENLQNVPVAVTAFTGADLQKQNAVTVTDVGRLTPGIAFRQSSTNPSGLLVSLRGQFQRDTVATLEPSVGTYVDGVYWARSYGLNADLVDLKNVQILKGPQGTLFGRNTTGGAIVMETNDPQYDKVSGMASVTYGRFNERVGTAVLNLPIVQDRVAIRGALQINRRDGYITDIVTGRKYDNRDNITGRVKLGIKATDDLNFIFSAERYRFKQNGQARAIDFVRPGSPVDIYTQDKGPIAGMTVQQFLAFTQAHPDLTAQNAGPGQPPAPVSPTDVGRYNAETYSGTANWQTGVGLFKAIGAYRGVKGHSSLDLEGSPWFIHSTYGSQDLQQVSGELQLTGKTLGDKLEYAAGAFYFKEYGTDGSTSYQFYNDLTSSSAFVRATTVSGAVTDAYARNKSEGVYGQSTYHVTDQWSFTGGLRYSKDDRGVTLKTHAVTPLGAFLSCSLASLGAVPDGNGSCTPVGQKGTFSNVSYLISTDYHINDDVMVYGKFSKGYRSGGVNNRANTVLAFMPFGPEIVHEAEVGVKSELFERRLRLNAAAYRNIIDGAQRSKVVPPPGGGPTQSIYGNAAKVRVWGLEADATAILGGGFRANVTGAITRPKYLSYTDAAGDHSHDRFNDVPREQFSVAGEYSHDMGFAQLNLHADYSWASATPLDEYNVPSDPFNAQIIAATTRPAGGEANVRAALSFDSGRYEVAAYGRNIFNRRVVDSALQVAGTASFGYVGATFTDPATYGIQATYHFGD